MRTVAVRVVPKSSRTSVQEEPGGLKVRLTRPAHDGEANEQLVGLLAGYFKTKKYNVTIVKGQTSRSKLVRIDE